MAIELIEDPYNRGIVALRMCFWHTPYSKIAIS